MLSIVISKPPPCLIDFEGITPESLSGQPTVQIGRLPVRCGNTEIALGELGAVEGDAGDGIIRVDGELDRVHRLGAGMKHGCITVHGAVGPRLGAAMAGGQIEVIGDAGDWLGEGMRGGRISVKGNVGDHMASAPPGASFGMRGGEILVHGNCGQEAGFRMRRGLIAVAGSAGPCLAHSLLAGTILVMGPCSTYPGAEMRRGTLVLLGSRQPAPPTYRFACTYRPQFLEIMLRHVQRIDFPLSAQFFSGVFDRYVGDLLASGKGELLYWRPSA